MRFALIDAILECSAERIVAMKQVSRAEEYLADHFPTFAVLPGVLMVETMVQAARHMLREVSPERLVLGEVKALRFGNLVRPGEQLIVEVTLHKRDVEAGTFTCTGKGHVVRAGQTISAGGETAVSGRFTMRAVTFDQQHMQGVQSR
ncbi:MAG: 3-hydroxyacyl-ACP dehydratase FabZ family protein [Phycisphaerales bacterium]